MAWRDRRSQLPPQFAAAIAGHRPHERIVAWATVPGERVVVATTGALWLPQTNQGTPLRRIGWERVDKATWREGTLAIVEADVVDELLLVDRAPVAVVLADPREVPAEVRRRVEASVAHSRVVAVTGGQIRVVARRVPGLDGLSWWVRLEGSTPDNPTVREQARSAITGLRAPVG